jgi:hypothetical protein
MTKSAISYRFCAPEVRVETFYSIFKTAVLVFFEKTVNDVHKVNIALNIDST